MGPTYNNKSFTGYTMLENSELPINKDKKKNPDARGTPRRPLNSINNEKKLIVGKNIHLSGEIGFCDFLIIEGQVKAEIKECYRLEIASTGAFIGSTHVEEA